MSEALYEVELKFAAPDASALRSQLLAWGAQAGKIEEQTDRYFAHPCKDFVATDEAFRVRSVRSLSTNVELQACESAAREQQTLATGAAELPLMQNFVTYKGPKLDKATKTRLELELPLARGASLAADYARLFEALGFRTVYTVHKRRECHRCLWQGHAFEVAVDNVRDLGCFVEIETQSNQNGLEQAKAALLSLSSELKLGEPIRLSYLGMLLQQPIG